MRILRYAALWTLAVAASLAADHPIIISSGSPLKIQHDGWKTPPGDDRTLISQYPSNTVTYILIAPANGKSQTFNFSGDQCTLTFNYRKIGVTVSTDGNGHNLTVKLDSGSHFPTHFNHNSDGSYSTKSPDASITNVGVVEGSTPQTVTPFSGPVRIEVHYE